MRRFTFTVLYALVTVLLMYSILLTSEGFNFGATSQKLIQAVKNNRNPQVLSQYRREEQGLQKTRLRNLASNGRRIYKIYDRTSDFIDLLNTMTDPNWAGGVDNYGSYGCYNNQICCGWSMVGDDENYHCTACCNYYSEYMFYYYTTILEPLFCNDEEVCLDIVIASIKTPSTFLCLDCYSLTSNLTSTSNGNGGTFSKVGLLVSLLPFFF